MLNPASNPARNADRWWRQAAIYQVYLRSFADGDGDGIGDLDGVRQRLPYLADLGVDAVWFTPWFPSPMADGGYDVADYQDIDAAFGTLAEAEKLITDAHGHGLRIIIDLVPNHCSSEHAWFRQALAAGPGSPQRARFWFRPGRGRGGDEPPNDWRSIFGGPAWTRTTNADGTPGEWYLHLFAPQQPDWNWDHPEVRQEFEDILRFWFDRGVDGVRIDSAALLSEPAPGAFTDRDDVHDIYRSWRRIAEEYEARVLIGEVWMPDVRRFTRYLRGDELHVAFNFEFLCCAWELPRLRAVIDASLASHAPVGAPATWVLSNHDVVRPVTRYGRVDTAFDMADRRIGAPSDLVVGVRRARAAALLSLALPGGVYVYQGEELGLAEVEDLPDEVRQDPIFRRSGRVDMGRDGCRVPMPWSGTEPPFGFSPDPASAPPWLPQPAHWASRTVAAQRDEKGSMLTLYRRALHVRRAEPVLWGGEFAWLPAGRGALAFSRGGDFACVINFGAEPLALPAGSEVLLSSGDLIDGRLPTDTAAWLRIEPSA